MDDAEDEARQTRMTDISTLLRRLKSESDRLALAVAADQHLGHTDIAALMHVMEHDAAGQPMTAGDLQRVLGLSSGATTAVVDRLEAVGHARRDRDPGDRRRIRLHWDTKGREVGMRYFGPLAGRLVAVLDGFDDAEQEVVRRFLAEVVEVYDSHATAISTPPEPSP